MNISSLAFESTFFPATKSASPTCRRLVSGRHPALFVCCSANPAAAVSSSVSVPESAKKDGLKRIGELSQVSGVLGCQWGDEGKGKLVDILAPHFEIVARCQVLSRFDCFYLFFLFSFLWRVLGLRFLSCFFCFCYCIWIY